jgi:GT2 family glycosyltransferase
VSDNIHEPRAYNRLARLARGQVLVLLADDDEPVDASCKWLKDVLAIFHHWPSMGVLGLRRAVACEVRR